ncbi:MULTISPECIES: DUF7018 domain-containing (lipo)protein [Bacillus cereus group]|uniref:DUF7018 domain-containing protein n=1 Tax=Bacillus cereus HuA3-9 TaxID=1053205 RepID=R8CHT8_BACCE|nr:MULTISPECIES: hypothetical protein [Bacillus cereus group]EOO11196.1 hypothetical protein IGA_05844 [Bacillus cereus HuA3-9]MED1406906.1 hypothetical protein [Bacillus mycoides]
MKLKLISMAIPITLLLGGCTSTKETTEIKASEEKIAKETSEESGETKYLEKVKVLTGDMHKALGKVGEVLEKDPTLYEVQEEFDEAIMGLRKVAKAFKELDPDSEYTLPQKKFVRAMDEFELATTKLILGMDDTTGYTFKDGINQYKQATDLYIKAGYQILDVRDGKELGTTQKEKEKE